MNILQMLKDSINTLYIRYIGNDEIENLPIYYIGGSQTLPPPLEPEEEEEVLSKKEKAEKEIKEALDEDVDDSFYTNSMSFSKKDFDSFDDDESGVGSVIVKILIVIVFIAIIVGVVIFLNEFLNLGWF